MEWDKQGAWMRAVCAQTLRKGNGLWYVSVDVL